MWQQPVAKNRWRKWNQETAKQKDSEDWGESGASVKEEEEGGRGETGSVLHQRQPHPPQTGESPGAPEKVKEVRRQMLFQPYVTLLVAIISKK